MQHTVAQRLQTKKQQDKKQSKQHKQPDNNLFHGLIIPYQNEKIIKRKTPLIQRGFSMVLF
jgi:hypothetical protein